MSNSIHTLLLGSNTYLLGRCSYNNCMLKDNCMGCIAVAGSNNSAGTANRNGTGTAAWVGIDTGIAAVIVVGTNSNRADNSDNRRPRRQ